MAKEGFLWLRGLFMIIIIYCHFKKLLYHYHAWFFSRINKTINIFCPLMYIWDEVPPNADTISAPLHSLTPFLPIPRCLIAYARDLVCGRVSSLQNALVTQKCRTVLGRGGGQVRKWAAVFQPGYNKHPHVKRNSSLEKVL